MNCTLPSFETQSGSSFNFSADGFVLEEEASEQISWKHVAELAVYGLVMFLSLLGNLSVVVAILTQRAMRTTINYYLLNMAVADIFIVLFCMWVHFMNVYIFKASYRLGAFMCRIEAFAKMTCLTACVLTLTAISCDRFVAILFPLHAAARITKQRTSCIILVIWCLSTMVALPLVVYSKLYTVQFAGQAEVSYCGSSWPGEARWSPEISECVIAYPTRKLYYFIAMVTLFFLPIGVMLTAYSFIIWKLWIHQVPGEFGNARSNGASASGQSSYGGMQYNKNNSVHNRSKKKVIRMACYVLLAFIICWMPLQATVLYSQIRDDSHKQMPAWFSTFSSFATFLAFSNSLVNPVIYGGFNRQFRQAILQLLRCRPTRVQATKMRSKRCPVCITPRNGCTDLRAANTLLQTISEHMFFFHRLTQR
ncbi:growth hormone secretagogue receptor type 1-like isoform X3 [Varroa destructor]|nr:growth hormone secretagogue receptor type 1-like isoform X3 [Varroa destructor]